MNDFILGIRSNTQVSEIDMTASAEFVLADEHRERAPSILEVRRGNPFRWTQETAGIQTLFEGKAAPFHTMWSQT